MIRTRISELCWHFERNLSRGVVRPGVMVGPLCDHFVVTCLKAIFHALRQYSQKNYSHYSFQTKVHCNLLKTNYV